LTNACQLSTQVHAGDLRQKESSAKRPVCMVHLKKPRAFHDHSRATGTERCAAGRVRCPGMRPNVGILLHSWHLALSQALHILMKGALSIVPSRVPIWSPPPTREYLTLHQDLLPGLATFWATFKGRPNGGRIRAAYYSSQAAFGYNHYSYNHDLLPPKGQSWHRQQIDALRRVNFAS
jgi:hypothetical protein